ncbi:hypothetical protein LMG1231_05893 [Achromobacter denitrificans]|nr:hypothetical protein LMG1231_05893 [Achromobacter denitrificans]
MLVWKAMPSMTETISTTLLELSVMFCMVLTTSATAALPRCATSEAVPASWFAWRALSAFCFTVAAICSMEAAVSSSEAACSSVRLDRSWLPAAIWWAPTVISSTPRWTADTVRVRLSCMRLMAANIKPISLLLRTSIRPVKSPSAIRSKQAPASCRGRSTMPRRNSHASRASARVMTTMAMAITRARRWSTWASSTMRLVAWSMKARKSRAALLNVSVTLRDCAAWARKASMSWAVSARIWASIAPR